ncbi:MAG: glycerol kinase GlpK [Planctomycetota bacterium]|jgi:glycerol kinase
MSLVLALDQGTTSCRAILFDQEGSVVGVAQKEFCQIFPKPGWVEHDPEEIWQRQVEVVGEVLAGAGSGPDDVAAIGITNQRETTVVWDRRSGEPVCNAIVWQDRRTAEACDRLRADGCEETIRAKTGLVVDAYFSATKLAWILDHVPGARERAEAGELAFGTIDSWLIWKLTRGACHVTEVSNASRTMLYDIGAGDWDPELLEMFRVPRSMLPEVHASSEVYAETSAEALPFHLPIAGIAGDQQAALFGQMCHDRGLAKNTFGTGCFVLLNTGEEIVRSRNNLVTTVAWKLGERTTYALEGSVFIGGAVIQWLRDGLGVIASSEEVETLARSVEDTGGVYLVPAFAGLGAPYWDPYARGTITGLTRGSTSAHIARAALEGIAHQVSDVLEAMRDDSGVEISQLRVDGGAARNELLMQFQADLLRIPIVRPKVLESTAFGAAALAGLAVGVWKSPEEVARTWDLDREYHPEMAADRVALLRSRWAEAVNRARAWEQPVQ